MKLMEKKKVKNNKILYFIIFKRKNLSLTNSFGIYKTYHDNGCELSDNSDNSKHKNLSSTDSFGQLFYICNYVDNKKMVKNNKILYFIIFKRKNLSSTNSFGEYKSYWDNGKLYIICNYIDDKIMVKNNKI